jgi:hypothetical protein
VRLLAAKPAVWMVEAPCSLFTTEAPEPTASHVTARFRWFLFFFEQEETEATEEDAGKAGPARLRLSARIRTWRPR